MRETGAKSACRQRGGLLPATVGRERTMESLFRYVAAPSRCGYLPDRNWSLEYEYVAEMTAAEYQRRMLEGWRRFGTMLFRPACSPCTACQAVRVVVADFQPDRSQRR